eukprot:TRINITY_DN3288_c0_g1_i1.p1 TRINITY_DN3288_c0_g1~~TRINITY_DN3288_c0_g1_i1.p1  ORF type:complete len:440 (+),score=140.96 TRINITY_DN3288_c0_g1_i1:83-1402(+)
MMSRGRAPPAAPPQRPGRRRSSVAAKDANWAEERKRQELIMGLNRKIAELDGHFERMRRAYAEAQRDLEREVLQAERGAAAERQAKMKLQKDFTAVQEQLEHIEKAVRRRASAEARWRQLEREVGRELNVVRSEENHDRSRHRKAEARERKRIPAILRAESAAAAQFGVGPAGCERREADRRAAVAVLEAEGWLCITCLAETERRQRLELESDEAVPRRAAAAAEAAARRELAAAERAERAGLAAETAARQRNYDWLEDTTRWRWRPGGDSCCPSRVDPDPRCEVLLCAPCQIARQQRAAEYGSDSGWSPELCCAAAALLPCPPAPGALVLRTRWQMRDEFTITEGSRGADVALALCCWPMLLCQHWQELRHRGRRPGGLLLAEGDELPPDAIPLGMLPPGRQPRGESTPQPAAQPAPKPARRAVFVTAPGEPATAEME